MVTSINNPEVMGLGFRDASSVPQYNTPTGQTTPRQNAAANLGYEQGKSSPLGLIPGMSMLKGPLGIGKNDTFGNTNTADSQGNVFAPNSSGINRAYDPITGRVVPGVAANLGSGIKTWSDSYGKLRGHGGGPIDSALGSYDGSVYKQMDDNPGMTISEGRAARLRGEGSPINSVAGRIGTNTNSMADNFNETGDATMGNKPVSAYDIGFDGSRSTTVNSTTGNWGSGAGDIVGLSGNQLGVLSPQYRDNKGKLQSTGSNNGDRVNLQSPTGTLVSITSSITGKPINATVMSAELRRELDHRAGKVDPNMTDANLPSIKETASMGGTGAGRYDTPDNDNDNNSSSSGYKMQPTSNGFSSVMVKDASTGATTSFGPGSEGYKAAYEDDDEGGGGNDGSGGK
jgi:hypothetical protein